MRTKHIIRAFRSDKVIRIIRHPKRVKCEHCR